MEYKELVKDFADRTRANLDTMRALKQSHPDIKIYEVTQLINSMLGLLVFPQQKYIARIPHTPLEELKGQGWPIPKVIGSYPQVKDLNQLVCYLRNSIAHFNLEFKSDDGQISGLKLWNERDIKKAGRKTKERNWVAELSIDDIEKITHKFTQLLLEK